MTSLTGLRTERKRAHDDSSARESDADASMWRHVTSPRLVKTATRPSIASPPGTNPQQGWPVLKNDYFYNECNNLFHQYLEQLNQQHLAFYKTYPDADPYWMQCEYVRQVNKYKELYQKPFTGLVLTCGSNDVDQLGSYGDTSVPRQLRVEQWKQDPPVKIHCGSTHNVVLGLHGHAYTFGNSDQGQLGRDGGDIDGNLQVTGFVPSKHAIVKTSLPADLENEDGCIIKAVGGNLQTLFLTIHGNVYTVGGIRDYDDKLLCEPRPPDDGIMPDDKKWPRGSNRKPTHLYEMPGKVKDISSGTLMSAALLNDGTVVTWGTGTRGELGRPVPSEIKGPDGKFHVESLRETFLKPHPVHFAGSPSKMSVISFACGSGHLMVVAREEGSIETTVYGTGLNKEGQLGLGDFEDRKILTPVRRYISSLFVSVFQDTNTLSSFSLIKARVLKKANDRQCQGRLEAHSGPGSQRSAPLRLWLQLIWSNRHY